MFGLEVPDRWVPGDQAGVYVEAAAGISPFVQLASDTGSNLVYEAAFWSEVMGTSMSVGVGGNLTPEAVAEAGVGLVGILRDLRPRPVYAMVVLHESILLNNTEVIGNMVRGNDNVNMLTFPDVCDEWVPGGFWYQVLGPGHRDRLGGWPRGAEVLDDDHAGVAFGRAEDWAAGGERRERFRRQAETALAPIVVHNDDEASDIVSRRPGRS
jgi:hypothetical protein